MSNRGPRIKASPARLAALEVGCIVRTRKAFTQEIIASHIDTSDLTVEDRAFATKLALGVTSTLGTLDEIINRFLRSPADLKPDVRDALRISAYEILFLDKSAHAAVDQGVELVKSVTPKATGLANAVLRKVSLSKKDFPFGDPEHDIEALARQFAFPSWLAQKLIDDMGRQAACLFMEASNEPAPIFLAVNSIKTDEKEMLSVFDGAGAKLKKITTTDIPLSTCFRLMDPRALQQPDVRTLFETGKVLVSDAASQMVAYLALPDTQAASFLEIGSGRGTKTILLQSSAKERYGCQIPLDVLDSHEFKMRLLKKRMKTYDVTLGKTLVGDARNLNTLIGGWAYDAVFVDAPCSGLGTLRRHPEIRWRIKPEDIASLSQLGADMLRAASQHVATGGMLTYSTCTVTKDENVNVIQTFLNSNEGKRFKIKPTAGRNTFATSLSPGSSDAHFAVRMVRVD